MCSVSINRRNFIKTITTASAAIALTDLESVFAAENKKRKWYKAIKIGMIPQDISDKEKFVLAKECGYEGIDGVPLDTVGAAVEQAKIAKDCGIPIHGLVYGGWHTPLSDPDTKVVEKGLSGMKHAIECANAIGADTVLLVPAIVTDDVPYDDAYKRSQDNVCKLISFAEKADVVIGIENVWNKFLLSPLEFARYLDECDSPQVRAYFDIGNVIITGFAHHWIRILNKRIIKLDLKDFKRSGYQWKNLRDGDVNWPKVCKALDDIGFEGYMTVEGNGGDKAYLADISRRIDIIRQT